MTPGTRIFVNMIASYGRSLFSIGLGLFSLRWVLEALGASDYGLYAVVGSLIAFVAFFNNILRISVARYYAYSIGEGSTIDNSAAAADLSRWFNAALSLHLIVPVIFILLGVPLAEYAIRNWINITPERIFACIWVFRIALLTSFVSMASVPFISMYTARQLIWELSLFGILSSVLNFAFARVLCFVSGDRLIVYAIFMLIVNAGIPLVQIFRAMVKFPECRMRLSFWGDWGRVRSILSFAGWTTFGYCGFMVGSQGNILLTNHFFGTRLNSTYGIAGQLAAHTADLASALQGAFSPAITTKEGSGDRTGTIRMAFRTGRLGAFLLIIFAIPLALELPEVVRLWLGNVPDYIVPVCFVTLCSSVVNKLTIGHQMAMNASGKIALWQFFEGGILILMMGFAVVFIFNGVGPVSAALGYFVSSFSSGVCVLVFCRRKLGMGIRLWIRSVLGPILAISTIGFGLGWLPHLIMEQSLVRVCVTTFVTLCVTIPLGWFWVLIEEERFLVRQKFVNGIATAKNRMCGR